MILVGDCLALLPAIRSASVDAIATDPPYGLAFMGKDWDHGVPGEPFWREALRVAKPGAYLVAAGGTRTFHRLACAIEDAGWEMRDCLSWLYGSGFPKGRACLKPAWEPWLLARKPGRSTHLNIDGCRIAGPPRTTHADGNVQGSTANPKEWGARTGFRSDGAAGRWPPNVVLDEDAAALLDEQSGALISNGGRPQMAVRKASIGYGGSESGPEALLYGDTGGASRFFYCAKASRAEREAGLEGMPAVERVNGNKWTDQDYRVASGERTEGRESGPRRCTHPTVKPLDLMRWLCRLVTPTGGLILDPFAGSGTTGCAAVLEGFRFLGMEREPEYAEIARRRIAYWESLHQPTLDFGGVA